MALAALERAGAPPQDRAELLLEIARTEATAGRYAESLRHATAAADAAERADRADLLSATALPSPEPRAAP